MPGYPLALALTNPGYETGDATGWATISGGPPAARASGTDGFAANSGAYYGMASSNLALVWWGQTAALDAGLNADIDAGILKATVGVWTKGHATLSAEAAIVIECFDGSGNWLAEHCGNYDVNPDHTIWRQKFVDIPLPSGTRSLRIGARGRNKSGSVLVAWYFDDWTLTIDTIGPSRMIVHAKGDDTTGWVATTGAISTAARSYGIASFYGAATAEVVAHRDVALDADLVTPVDAGDCTLRSFFLLGDTLSDNFDFVRFWLECRDAGGTVLATLQSDTTPQRYPLVYAPFDVTIDIPAGTRSFRLNWDAVRANGSNDDGYLARVSAFVLQPATPAAPSRRQLFVS